jgi:heterodisulfide reductase subunit A-like polyferredoxin
MPWPAGQKVELVEKADRLGGAPILSGYARLVPSHEWAKDAIGGMVDRVEENPLVKVHLNATVKQFKGAPGDFVRAAVERQQRQGRGDDPGDRLHPFRSGEQARMGLRHL